MAYRMVFSDMDGTLLKSASELSEKNIKMVGKAVDQGVEFVICTGRGVYGVERFLENCISWVDQVMSSARMALLCITWRIWKWC